MKYFIYLFSLFLGVTYGQVGIGTNTPNSSAVLDIQANDKGVLIPRLTEAERIAITNPAEGLLVFQDGDLYYYTNYTWKTFKKPDHYIGEYFQGGIVFQTWRDKNAIEHGLIVSLNELGTSNWSNNATTYMGLFKAKNIDGDINCIDITTEIGHTSSAAKTCLDLTENGFDDWYLPSIHELEELYKNIYSVNENLNLWGGTSLSLINNYWSSTEGGVSAGTALYFKAETQEIKTAIKSNIYSIRAIRKF